MILFGSKNKAKYSAREVLKQLDKCAEDFTFPMLDNGYIYPIDSKLTIFRDKERWVLIIEVVGFNYRGGGHNGIDNALHIFGNCLKFEPGTNNANFIRMTDDSDEGPTFDEEYQENLNPNVHSMMLRDKKIKVVHDVSYYESKGIELEEPPNIKIWEFLRAINSDYKNEFLATEGEIRNRIPTDLPLMLTLNEWHHNDLASGEKPSENETFQMIANVLENGKTEYYKPTKQPNNHWSNWPEGGTL